MPTPPLRLLVLTYYWPPSGGAGVQRCLKWVKYLPELGVEPTVITVDPDQASYPVRDESLLREVPPGVRVIRTATLEPFESYQKLTGRAVPHGGFANEGKPSAVQQAMRFVRGNFFCPTRAGAGTGMRWRPWTSCWPQARSLTRCSRRRRPTPPSSLA